MFALRNKIAVLALALTTVTFAPAVTYADTVEAQPIYAHNNTSRPIWVAAEYIPPGSSSFVTDGWWQIDPGESTLILYNNGRNIYFFAHDDQGTVWDGHDTCTTVRGERVDMFQMDTGRDYCPWTMNFNP